LAFKGLPWQYVPVHLTKDGGEQRAPEFLALNPMGEVPLLLHGERCISQSGVILEYLDYVQPSPPLFPSSLDQRLRVRMLCDMVGSGIQPLQNLKVLNQLTHTFSADQASREAWSRHWIEQGFKAIHHILAASPGPYCLGGLFSAADCFLLPQLYNARRFGLDLEPFPRLLEVEAAVHSQPWSAATHPDVQPDAPSAQ
jgi:maleylacetoacetate isomerase